MTLPPERPGHAAPEDLAARRSGLAAAIAGGMGRTDPPPDEEWIDAVRVLRLRPARASCGTVLHLHGGAFRIGCPEQVAPFAAALAKRCGVELVCPAYRLAPEHPFPAALNDALRVLNRLTARGGSILLSGDSAGGALATSLAVLASARGIALAGLILLSPWLDLTAQSPSYDDNGASDPLFSRAAARDAAALYLQGHDANDSIASPLFGPVGDLPPAFLGTGAGEVLADDTRRFAGALTAAGRNVELHIIAGMEHVAVTRDLALPGAARTFDLVADFVDRRLAATRGAPVAA